LREISNVKTLHLLRHAKSSWAAPETDDHDRDLNERGQRDARRMGAALSGMLPPLPVYVSSALRARRTLEGLCERWPVLGGQSHCIEDALYTFDYRDLLAWLQECPGPEARCFVLGHNPALTDLCNQLLGRPALDNLPTAGYLELTLPVEHWGEVTEGIGQLERWLFPRDLRD
jgi:phosphohistidine phosphatase